MKPAPLGEQLREWRVRRRMSQMDLALDSEISTRHLSFIETGRSKPSAAMLQRIADCLEVPHRARNALLLAGGYAPDYQERPLDSPEMAGMRAIVEHVLKGHEPYPALAVDRHWSMIAANAAVALLMQLAAPELLEPPVNVLRVAMHPKGLAPHIVNHGEWRAHLLERLDHARALEQEKQLRRQGVARHVLVEAGDEGILLRLLEQELDRQPRCEPAREARLAGADRPLHHQVAEPIHGR